MFGRRGPLPRSLSDPDEQDSSAQRTWYTYLSQLKLYFLALGMAGSSKLDPQPSDVETLTSSSTSYMSVSYDLLMK